MKYRLLTAEELIKHSESIESCIKTLDKALGCVVCIDGGEKSIVEWLKSNIYNILSDPILDNYVSEMGGGRLSNIYTIKKLENVGDV